MPPCSKLLSRLYTATKFLVHVFPSLQNMILSLDLWDIFPSARYTLKQWNPLFHLLKKINVFLNHSQSQTCLRLHCDTGELPCTSEKGELGKAELLVHSRITYLMQSSLKQPTLLLSAEKPQAASLL